MSISSLFYGVSIGSIALSAMLIVSTMSIYAARRSATPTSRKHYLELTIYGTVLATIQAFLFVVTFFMPGIEGIWGMGFPMGVSAFSMVLYSSSCLRTYRSLLPEAVRQSP